MRWVGRVRRALRRIGSLLGHSPHPEVGRTFIVAGFVAFLCVTVTTPAGGAAIAEATRTTATGGGVGTTSSWDWPSYGHDAQHTFHGRSTLTEKSARALQVAWTFPTGDAVTATPTVVDGSVYVGSWDGYFYDIALATGQLRWKFQLNPQPAVTPFPGQNPRDATSDGGLITSSAWFEPGGPTQPDLVIFGGGYTLYALNAESGGVVWEHDYTGLPEQPPDPTGDNTRIFSSPVVDGGKIIFGVDTDGEPGHRGYVVAANLETGDPVWQFQTDVNAQGQIMDDGCGNVWSSGTVIPSLSEVVFDVADCNGSKTLPLDESVIALDIGTGRLVWSYQPPRPDQNCDLDFGATANAGLTSNGRAKFLGVGSKDGSYYSLDPRTGHLRWSTNVVFGGPAGGFIGSTAYDEGHVYGSTALGDVGNATLCDPNDPFDTALQEPTVHAFDAHTGQIIWQGSGGASLASTTVARGMTFNCLALHPAAQIHDAKSGTLVDQLRIPVPCWSGVATVGNALVFGTGTTYLGSPDGVIAFTPGGKPPRVPAN